MVDKEKAYAKLEGDGFCYYIHTLRVILGRTTKLRDRIDIALGNVKSVSRQHAHVFYNFALQRFELTVFGKNGAFINERYIEKGVTIPLENRTKIQIGEVCFQFSLCRQNTSELKIQDNCISIPQQLEKAVIRKPTKIKLPKPPYSYVSLITQAIDSTRDKKMTLEDICAFISNSFPYYRQVQKDWQNSIRHNLSSNKTFVKIPKEAEKGPFWTIRPKETKLEATPETADQVQAQLQETLCQHLLDPEHYPLPSSLVRLLPQAVAQLPPHLADQLSSNLASLKPE